MNQIEQDLARIASAQGIPALEKVLAHTFGAEPVTKAVRTYGELLRARRDARVLTFSGGAAGGLSIVTPPRGIVRDVPPNRYHGDGDDE